MLQYAMQHQGIEWLGTARSVCCWLAAEGFLLVRWVCLSAPFAAQFLLFFSSVEKKKIMES